MMIHHIAIWAEDIDAICSFYERYFFARRGGVYANPTKGFQSCFLEFGHGARIEVMHLDPFAGTRAGRQTPGYAHVSISLGSQEGVDRMAELMRTGGVALIDGPRWTGDGYYECVVLDPEGNTVEITI